MLKILKITTINIIEKGENLSQINSLVDSQAKNPLLDNKIRNDANVELDEKMQVLNEGHLISNLKSLDRLAINFDLDIARYLDFN